MLAEHDAELRRGRSVVGLRDGVQRDAVDRPVQQHGARPGGLGGLDADRLVGEDGQVGVELRFLGAERRALRRRPGAALRRGVLRGRVAGAGLKAEAGAQLALYRARRVDLVAALEVVGQRPAQAVEPVVQARARLSAVERVEARGRPPARDDIGGLVALGPVGRDRGQVVERVVEGQAVGPRVVDADPVQRAAGRTVQLGGRDGPSRRRDGPGAGGPRREVDRASGVGLEHPAAHDGRGRSLRDDQAQHDPAVGQGGQAEARRAARVGQGAAQQCVGRGPVQMHARRARRPVLEHGRGRLGVLAVGRGEGQRDAHGRLGVAGGDHERLHVDRDEHPALADEARVPAPGRRGVQARAHHRRPALRGHRLGHGLGLERAHPSTLRKSIFSWATLLVGRKTSSIGGVPPSDGSPKTWR